MKIKEIGLSILISFTLSFALITLVGCGDKRAKTDENNAPIQPSEEQLNEQQKELGKNLVEKSAQSQLAEVKKLISNGAPINFIYKPTTAALNINGTPVRYGVSSLHVAAIGGYSELAQYLISKGALLNIKTEKGLTALDMTLIRADSKTSAVLIQGGPTGGAMDKNKPNENSKLVLSASTWTQKDVSGQNADDISKNINAADAARAKILAAISEKRVPLNLTWVSSEFPYSPLHASVQYPTTTSQVLRKLIAMGFNLNSVDPAGDTPLHTAVNTLLRGNINNQALPDSNLVKILVDANADLKIKNAKGQTAIDLALAYPASRKRGDVLRVLRSRN